MKTQILLASILFLTAQLAFAFQTARTSAGGAQLRSEPKAGSTLVESLQPSSIVTIGDQPTQGFYRARAMSGKVGWISQNEVVIVKKTSTATPKGSTVNVSTSAKRGDGGDSPVFSMGAALGMGIFTGGGSTSAFSFGLNGDYRFDSHIAAGLYFTYASLASASAGGVSVSSGFMVLAPEANYFLDRTYEGLYAGGKLGLGISRTTTTVSGLASLGIPDSSQTSSKTALAIGPAVGYLYVLKEVPGLSIGGEANLLYISSSGSGMDINFLAMGRYSF